MDESSTPTALVKIFGDFESRVKTASRRTFEGHEGIRRHASGSALPSHSRASGMSSGLGGLRGRLKFEESSLLLESSPSSSSRKRRILEDPLEGLDRYPKAVKSEDSRQMQAEIERLKMQLIQKDADIVSLEADVKKGEAVLKKMQVEITKDKILRENERESLVRKSRLDHEKIADLETRIQILTQRKEHQQDYDFPIPQQVQDEAYQNEVERLTEELIQLRDEIYELRTDFQEKESAFKNQIVDLQSKNEHLEAQIKENQATSEAENSSSGIRLELEQTKGKLEMAKQEIKELQSQIEATNEDRIQHRIMKEKLDAFARMENNIENLKVENKLLNDTADNTHLLKEQLEDLKEKCEIAESSLQQSRQKQEELVFAERQLNQWRQLLYRLFTTQERSRMQDNLGPDALAAKISQLQQEIIEKSEVIETQKSHLKEKDRGLQDLKGQLSEAAQGTDQDKQNLTEQANLIKRFKRKLLLVTKERDSYKGVLESYEHELTFTGAAFEKDRIGALESTLKDYQDTIEKLEELLQAARSNKQEAEVIQGLKNQIECLQNQLLEAEQSSSSPEKPAAGEKILHFLDNPLSQAMDSRQAEFEELKNENHALKARVQLLEEGQTKDLTLLVGQKMDEGASSEEVKELKEQLKAAEIRKQRLIEAFKKTSQDFREVSYRLTGFRIDGLSDGKYRLSPVYAESPDEYLLFKREESGECMLLETEYSSLEHVQKLIRLHLQQQNSIPVFLAAVITDMFSRQTFDTMDDDDEEEEENEDEPQEVQEEEEVIEEEVEEEEEIENAESEDIEEESVHDEHSDEGEEQEDDDDDDIVCID